MSTIDLAPPTVALRHRVDSRQAPRRTRPRPESPQSDETANLDERVAILICEFKRVVDEAGDRIAARSDLTALSSLAAVPGLLELLSQSLSARIDAAVDGENVLEPEPELPPTGMYL